MALIQSGATTDLLTVDPTSKAARVTIYDPNGNLAASSHPSAKVLQTNATITASGNTLFTNVDSSSITLFINIEANPTGTSPTLTYTVAEVDPNDQATVVGQTITGSALNSITTQQLTISQLKSNTIRVSWVLGGSNTPTFTQVNSIIVGQSAGSVTANIGSTGGLALDATLTGGNLKAQMYDGTNVVGTNAHPVRVDPTGTTTQPISGTITANAGTGTFTVGGTITANVGTTNGLALDATVSGLQIAQGSSSSGQKGGLIQGASTTAAPSYTTGTSNPLSLTTSGALRVDGSGATQPVSGTITANQGGTWTVQPGNTANTTPWLTTINQGGNSVTVTGANALKVDGSGATQPVSGTVTANAGSGTFAVSGTVISNIGTTNGLVLDATVSGLQVSQGSTTSGQKGGLTQGAVTTSSPSYTTGQTSPFSLTTSGALRTDSSATTQPVSGTITANVGTTGGLALDATLTGGTVKAQMYDGTNVIGTSSHPVKTDPTGTTTQPVSGTITANAGSGTFTVSGTVTSNIGTTNGLALDSSVNGILLSQGSTTSGQTGPITQGAVTTGAPTYTTGKTSPLSLTTSGALRTDSSATTQPISGTITANAGSGTFAVGGTVTSNQGTGASLSNKWPVQITDGTNTMPTGDAIGRALFHKITDGTNTAAVTSGSALKIDGSGTTQPISGTVTANIGTSGSLALDTSINGILVSQGSTTSGEKGPLIQGAVTTSAPTYTTSQTSPLSLTTVGNLRVDGSSVTQPVSGTITANVGTTNGLALDATLTGGTLKAQVYDGTNVLGTSSHPVKIDPTGTTTQPVSGTITANIGTTNGLALDSSVNGILLAQSSTTSGQTGPIIQGAVTTSAPSYTTGKTSPLSLTTSGALRTDSSATTQPVSGTITANAGSGTFAVSGTVTANIGTSGSLALDTTVSGLQVSQGSATSGQKGGLTFGAVTTSSPSYTTAQSSPLSLTTSGALRTDGSATTQPISGTITANAGTGNFGVNIAQVSGASVSTAASGIMKIGITDSSGASIALGQTTMAASVPIVIASNQSALPVSQSGTWNVGLNSGSNTVGTVNLGTTQSDRSTITQSLNMTATTNNVALTAPGTGTASVQITGATWTGTLIFEATTDGSNWYAINAIVPTSGAIITTTTANGQWLVPCAGYAQIRLRCSTTGSNSATVSIEASAGTQTTTLANSLPTGSNTIGAVTGSGSFTVAQATAANLNATVTGTITANQGGTWTVQPGNTVNTTPWLATINQGGNSATVTGSNALKVDGSSVTQPVSGTVTANIGTSGSLALDTSVNGILLSQGSTTSGQKGNLTQGAVTTSAPSYTTGQTSPLSITTVGNLRVDGSSVTQPVSGTVTANAGTGSFIVAQATAANLNATVTGTVTSNIGTTNGLALDSSVNGVLVSQGSTTSGEKGPLIQGAVTTSSPSYTTAQTSPLSLTTAGALRTDASATTQPVSGTITSNQGTANSLANAWSAKITDATNGPVAVKPASTAAVATDPALVVAISPNNSITASNPSVSATGSATPSQATYVGGSVTTAAPSYTTGQLNALSLNTNGGLRVDGSGVTQPVSGTITANIGTSGSLALDTSVNGILVSQGATTSGEKGPLIQGAVTTSAPSYTTAQTSPLSLTTVGNLRVDGSSVTQPVSGTITANAGTGSFTVAQATAANLNATVTGTVTSNIGTTNGLALDTSVNGVLVAQGSTTSGEKGPLIQGAVTTSAPSYTTAQTSPLSLTTVGNLRVDGSSVTQPVSGTITANIGTSGSLALDTSVNGVLVAQGSTTSGEKGPLIQGAVTTSAPSYTTAQTSPLSLTTVGNLRVDGSSVTQPVSGTVTSNQGTAAGLGSAWPIKVTDGTNTLPTGDAVGRAIFHKITDGTNTQTVKAASTVPATTDQASVVSISPNSIAATDRAVVTAGTQQSAVISGLDGFTINRIARVGEYGTQRTTSEIMLWHDALEGSTVNTFWTQSTTTMTIAQATGVLTLNNSNITTLSTNAIITSVRQFPKYPRNPLYARFRANITANVASNHTLVEMGFGAPSGTTAVINNGAFFRWRVDGTLAVVVSYNGTEKVTQVLAQGTINTSNYYYYDIIIDDDFARFLVSDAAGTPVVDTQISLTLTFAFTLAVSHIPSFARVYVDATGGGTAIKLNIAAHTVQMLDGQMPKPWEQQLASCMRSSSINPTSYASTPNLVNAAAPTTATPSNTASAYTTLGGEYGAAATAGSESILSLFGFTVPSPYTFYLRGLYIPLPVVQGAAVVTAPLLQWFIAPNASSTNLSTATGLQRITLPGMMNAPGTPAIGTLFSGTAITWTPQVPIVCLPGTVLHIGYKSITGAATASLVYRGSVYVDGFFE